MRPWLLIPKVLGVAMYFGGVTAAAAIAFSASPATAAEHQAVATSIARIFLFAAVPGLVLAILCGLALLASHGKPFLRLRWLQVKLALLVVTIPLFHIWISGMVADLRQVEQVTTDVDATFAVLRVALLLAAALAVIVIVLGRHKPRLGQGPGSRTTQETST